MVASLNRFFKETVVCVFLLMQWQANAQLSPFTLQVVPIVESCTANGRLDFMVTNTTPSATILYTIYRLPNTNVPIAVISANTLTGLVSGNYRVIATQSLGDLSNSQQQDVFISNGIINLNYTLTGTQEICGVGGSITVHITHGIAVSYEIFSGPVTRPLQSSPTFNNLPAGQYNVRVFDQCGEGLARAYTVDGGLPPGLNASLGYVGLDGCNGFSVNTLIRPTANHVVCYPLIVQATVFSASGPTLVFNYNINNGSGGFSFNVPNTYNTYNVQITDGSGNHYSNNGILIQPPNPMYLSLSTNVSGCISGNLLLNMYGGIPPMTVSFLSAPSGFNPNTFNANHPGPFNGSANYNSNSTATLPQGSYTVQITDSCGKTSIRTISLGPQPPVAPRYYTYPLCDNHFSSLSLSSPNPLISVQLVSAPANYPSPLPENLTSLLNFGGLSLGPLPVGNYVFNTTDSCNNNTTVNVTLAGLTSYPASATITEHCDSFDLFFQQSVSASSVHYLLQKKNPVTGLWGHPVTGFVGQPNVYDASNCRFINLGNNPNLQFSGEFRIIREIDYRITGSNSYGQCFEQVYTFEYYVGPRINHVYSFACANGLYDAVVIAQGYDPLKYRITAKNGQPFFINNNLSNIFLGIEPAIYNFQIEDACGNILNSLFDISNPTQFPVQPSVFCEGQSASLSVPGYSFLNYQWTKDNSPTVLSTDNTLNFSSFSAATHNGVYHVRIYYTGNPNSCIDLTVDYPLQVVSIAPEAGTGQEVQYCGSQGVIDLFSFLTGNYDPGGIWQEISSSGVLNQNLWDSSQASSGTYTFKYKVTGNCNTFDESEVSILIKNSPEAPAASAQESICNGDRLYLFASNVTADQYQWEGPNGFSSSEQNPIIESASSVHSGIYSVKTILDQCESAASDVSVTVNPLPEFIIEGGCVNNQFQLNVIPIDDSFNPNQASYQWTGPGQFTGSQNPQIITGKPIGEYHVTVTNAQGCYESKSIDLKATLCSVPNVVSPNNDNVNDVFDLSGLQVKKFEVYSRWGRLVYSQDHYTNQWHGQNNNNEQLPNSTYYYIVFLQSGEEKIGWIYVTE
ncbi:MAG: gliding motility-associated C-terminal domain-containing protein [Bacteroidetes bacterium]|nr:gliding motility-associated C-terminal domain-containing protein [Bacteroidota bacterium]